MEKYELKDLIYNLVLLNAIESVDFNSDYVPNKGEIVALTDEGTISEVRVGDGFNRYCKLNVAYSNEEFQVGDLVSFTLHIGSISNTYHGIVLKKKIGAEGKENTFLVYIVSGDCSNNDTTWLKGSQLTLLNRF